MAIKRISDLALVQRDGIQKGSYFEVSTPTSTSTTTSYVSNKLAYSELSARVYSDCYK